MPGRIEEQRRAYHRQICHEVLRQSEAGVPNNADSGNAASVRIGRGIIDRIGFPVKTGELAGQTAGHRFETATKDFLCAAFGLLAHLRPGEWEFSLGGNIGDYEQYQHLSEVSRLVEEHKELRIVFGDYIVTPDIVVCRAPVADETINENDVLLGEGEKQPRIRLCVVQIRKRTFCTPAFRANGRFAATARKTHGRKV